MEKFVKNLSQCKRKKRNPVVETPDDLLYIAHADNLGQIQT